MDSNLNYYCLTHKDFTTAMTSSVVLAGMDFSLAMRYFIGKGSTRSCCFEEAIITVAINYCSSFRKGCLENLLPLARIKFCCLNPSFTTAESCYSTDFIGARTDCFR